MNLIEKWKNRETKAKLREENIRLTERNKELDSQLKASFGIMNRPNIIREERNIHKLMAKYLVRRDSIYDCSLNSEYIKHEIAKNMVYELEQIMDFDFHDTKEGRIYIGSLYIATGDRKYK